MGDGITSMTMSLPEAVPGGVADGSLGNEIASYAVESAVAQVDTIVVGAAHDGDDYTVTVNGVVVTINYSDGSPTAAEVRAALLAALLADGNVTKIATPSSYSTASIKLTGVVAGAAFDTSVANTHTDLSVTTTTAPVVGTVKMGRAVVRKGIDSDGYPTIGLPTSSGDEFMGVTTFAQVGTPNASPDASLNASGGALYTNGMQAGVLTRGRIRVELEDDVDATSDGVFMRHAAAGDLTELGIFTPTDDGNTVAVPYSKWIKGGSAGEFGIVEISIP